MSGCATARISCALGLISGAGNDVTLSDVSIYDRHGDRLVTVIHAPSGPLCRQGLGSQGRDRLRRRARDQPDARQHPCRRHDPPGPVHALLGRPGQPVLLAAARSDQNAARCRPAGRESGGLALAQDHRAALLAADAATGIGRRLRHRALGPAVRARGHRHGAWLYLLRGRQFRAVDGQSRRLSADPRGLGRRCCSSCWWARRCWSPPRNRTFLPVLAARNAMQKPSILIGDQRRPMVARAMRATSTNRPG